MNQNPYETLKIPHNATQSVVRSAYIKLSKIYHPDVNNGSKESEENFKLLNEAYQTLQNEKLRKVLDSKLAHQGNLNKDKTKNHKSRNENPYNQSYTFDEIIYKMTFWVLIIIFINSLTNNLNHNIKTK